MNTVSSAKGRTVQLISHEVLLQFLLGLCFSHVFEVGGAPLEKRDVIYFHVPF